MSTINQLASSLYSVVTESDNRKPKPYDTKAEVLRTEGNIVWVKIPGGIDETPIQRTNNANPGDTVMVRVAGGRAWLLGNNTSPATDDAMAIVANDNAQNAGAIADIAIKNASEAQDSAARAYAAAGSAFDAADDAQTAADDAQRSADNAYNAATSAQVELSIVEDVAGTLNWIRNNASYELTEDQTVQEGTIYFIYNEETEDYEPIIFPDPELNPSEEGWYILNVESSQSDFIMAHLAVTSRGLWVLPNGIGSANDPQYASNYKALLSNDGTYFYDGSGTQVAKYGAEAMIGSETGAHIKLSVEDGYTRMGLWENDTSEVAYITNQKLEIRQAVVVDSIEIGNWAWVQKDSGTLRLQWIGET